MIDGIKSFHAKGKRYNYDRITGARIMADIGTPEFMAEVIASRAKPPTKKARRARRVKGEMAIPAEGRGRVYIVGFGPYVKIGVTNSWEARFKMIQSHAPESVIVYALFFGNRILEREIQSRFAECHIRGEWFKNEGILAEWIKEVA